MLYRDLRQSPFNQYLTYIHRNEWDTDKKVACRLQNNRDKQFGGIFIFGGCFDSIGAAWILSNCFWINEYLNLSYPIDPISFIVNEKFQALDSESAIITGRNLEQATSMARLSTMSASFDRFGNAVAIGGTSEL